MESKVITTDWINSTTKLICLSRSSQDLYHRKKMVVILWILIWLKIWRRRRRDLWRKLIGKICFSGISLDSLIFGPWFLYLLTCVKYLDVGTQCSGTGLILILLIRILDLVVCLPGGSCWGTYSRLIHTSRCCQVSRNQLHSLVELSSVWYHFLLDMHSLEWLYSGKVEGLLTSRSAATPYSHLCMVIWFLILTTTWFKLTT